MRKKKIKSMNGGDWGTVKGKHARKQVRKVAPTETSKVMREEESNERSRQVENEGAYLKQRVSRCKDGRKQYQLLSEETDMTNRGEYREGKMETGLWRNAERVNLVVVSLRFFY